MQLEKEFQKSELNQKKEKTELKPERLIRFQYLNLLQKIVANKAVSKLGKGILKGFRNVVGKS